MELRFPRRLALAALCFAAGLASADRVTLANGDRLTGKVLQLTEGKLVLETSFAGKLEIDRKAVTAIETEDEVKVMREGTVGVYAAKGPIALEGLRYVNPTPELSGIGTAYRGRFTLSSAWVRGNSESSTSLVESQVEARALRYRWEAGITAKQAEESGEETASSWLARASYDRFIAPKRFLYGRGSVERDRFAGIALRTTLGAGYGVQLREDETTKLSLRAGLEAVFEEPLAGPTSEHPAFGWGLRFARQVFKGRAEAFVEQDGFWSLEDGDDVTLRTRSGLRVPLIKGLTATTQLNVDWDNRPEPGRESTDATLLLGLGYDW